MISQSLIQQYLNQVLNSLSRVLIVLLLLKVVFLKLFDHLLSTCTQLAIELNHRHVFDHKVISASAFLVFFISRIFILVLVSSGCRLHCRQFSLLILLELVFHDILLNLSLLRKTLYHVLLLCAVKEMMLVNHLKDRRDVVWVHITARVQRTISRSIVIKLNLFDKVRIECSNCTDQPEY